MRCVALLLVLLAGCSTPKRHELEMDPLYVITSKDIIKNKTDGAATGNSGTKVIAIGNESELFKTAVQQYKGKKYEQALTIYDALVTSYPDSKHRFYYFYNRGLTLKKLQRLEDALTNFKNANEAAEFVEDQVDSRFQVGIVLQELKRWGECATVFKELAAKGLKTGDRIECIARLGICLEGDGLYDEALTMLSKAVFVYKKHVDDLVINTFSRKFAALAQYHIGEINLKKFSDIKFKLPVESMKESLKEKNRFFIKSQHAYLDAIRLNDHQVGTASNFKIAHSYELYYLDMKQAEIPDDIDGELRDVYFNELKKLTKPYIRRAIEIYQLNLKVSKKLGVDNEWIEKTRKSLERLKQFYHSEFKDLM